MRRVHADGPLTLGPAGRQPEAGRDQRGVGLDVGAHHEDVARLERRVVLEQADQHLAQHVDLPRRAVTGVHLEAPVARVVTAAGALVDRRRVVGPQVVLKQPEEGRRVAGRRQHGVARREPGPAQRAAQLTRVAAQRGEQRVTDQPGRLVLVTGDDSADVLERVPENRGSLREVQVDVAVLSERGEQVHLGRGQPGVPEERQPGRQIETGTTGAQGRDRRGVAQVGRRRVDAGQQPSPQLGLPGEVGVQVAAGPVGVAPLAPVGDEGGPLDGVRREQRREPDRHAVAAVAAHLEVVARQPVAEVGGQGRAPVLAEAGVDGGEQRPDQALGIPRVVLLPAEEQRDQGPRLEEAHPRAHPVAAGPDPEPVGEPLGQPPLHAAGGDDDDLLGQRVVERARQQVPQRLRQQVGARGPVQVERHAATLCGGADTTGPARSRDARRPSCVWCR